MGKFTFVGKRPLFHEDLREGEQNRLEDRRQEVMATMPERVAKATTGAGKGAKAAALALPHVEPILESTEQTADRIADHVLNQKPHLRMPGEGTVPGAPWYTEHNGRLRAIADATAADFERTGTSSSSMSPLNAPVNELQAAHAIAHATVTNAPTRITPGLHDHLKRAVAATVKPRSGEPKAAHRARQQARVAELVPDDFRGRDVGFNELHPDLLPHLGSSALHVPSERRKAEKALGKKLPATPASDVDWEGLARAGTNRAKGALGARGVSHNELSPPATAPKVNIYGHNGMSMEQENKGEIEWRASDMVARHRYLRGEDTATNQHGESFRLPAPHDIPMDFSDTHDDTVHVTPEIQHHVREFSDIDLRVGPQRLRDMHPAAVMALSHPSADRLPGGRNIRLKAGASSQHPTVQDSWANGIIHGQPNVSIANAAAETNVLKVAGSETPGYWGTKSLDDGTPILDPDRGADHGPAALQHAEYDRVTRMAAHRTRERLQLPYDAPSTVFQAAPWTTVRREAGKDEAFNAAQKAETKVVRQQLPRRHSLLSADQLRATMPGKQGELF